MRVEESVQVGEGARVGRVLTQRAIVEQLAVEGEGRVLVRYPQHDHLFEGDLAVGDTVGDAVEIVVDGGLAAIDGDGRELIDEAPQQAVRHVRADVVGQIGQRILHDVGGHLSAVGPHDEVENLVNEAHGVDLARRDGLLREVDHVAPLVNPLGEDTGGVEVGEEDVTAQREEAIVKLIAVAGAPRDMECVHGGSLLPARAGQTNRSGRDLLKPVENNLRDVVGRSLVGVDDQVGVPIEGLAARQQLPNSRQGVGRVE